MNLLEHPLTLDIKKRLAASEEDYIAATVLLPGLPELMGELRDGNGGLFMLTTNIKLGTSGQVGRVDFAFAADKAVALIYPTTQEAPEPSRIIS